MQNHQDHFNALYKKHYHDVYNAALYYLQNVEEAEEIVQDVFLQVHRSISLFRAESSLKTWILKITMNKCRDLSRKKKSRKAAYTFGTRTHDQYEIDNIPNFEHPSFLLENQERAALLYQTIDELPEKQKAAFLLSKVEGLTNIQVADILEVSVGATEQLLIRARAGLKTKLMQKSEEYRRKA